ncbi:hypothetical protein LSTR_LSTR003850 [Laodelphax striatellus]|uniref:Secreted protein n=1 Tax=Laodelphax striatellus TaxID=195883 RepID=A0A482XF54_LAOST|nr:hypothetical protein LSTR_LSTR003850 [Laodelphax striatellus]
MVVVRLGRWKLFLVKPGLSLALSWWKEGKATPPLHLIAPVFLNFSPSELEVTTRYFPDWGRNSTKLSTVRVRDSTPSYFSSSTHLTHSAHAHSPALAQPAMHCDLPTDGRTQLAV